MFMANRTGKVAGSVLTAKLTAKPTDERGSRRTGVDGTEPLTSDDGRSWIVADTPTRVS